MSEPWWTAAQTRLGQQSGLNLCGVADGAPWQEVLPGCRSVLVFASGGTALWSAMLTDLKAHPRHLADEANPLDAFVQRGLQAVDPHPPASRRWVRCAADADIMVDFRSLAVAAGLGWPSRLGLLIHPSHGLWLGLRAACFTTDSIPPTGPRAGSGPCEGCPAPCVSACPAGAVSDGPLGPAGAWDVQRCAHFHQSSSQCERTCHSRVACPEGAPHRYSDAQRAYHYHRASGRTWLRAQVGLQQDEHEGTGPHWGAWEPVP